MDYYKYDDDALDQEGNDKAICSALRQTPEDSAIDKEISSSNVVWFIVAIEIILLIHSLHTVERKYRRIELIFMLAYLANGTTYKGDSSM